MRYEDASHTGAFQGQGPIANDDTDQLAAGAKSTATGNLITGEGTQTGSVGADVATDGHITAIAGKSGEDSSFSGGKLSVMGEYGKLSVDAEGNYVYQANKGVENVRDRFTYTLADNQGASDSASLIVEIGKTPLVIKANAQQIVVGPDGVVTLPAGVELSDIHVVGRNLVVDMPDGSQMIIIDGAVFVPQLVLGGVEVPATNVAALLVGQEIQPAAGENTPSSGGNFAVPPPPLDPGVPLGDLIPPTEYTYIPPEPQEVFDILDRDPEAGAANALLDDDAQPGGNPLSNIGDDPGGAVANGNLPGSEGDGSLAWALLASGTLPAGFSFSPQGNGDVWILQGGVHVLTVHVDPANGNYTVTQVLAIDHPAGGDENNLIFVINYSVTDDDGDAAIGTLTINVDDDTPSVSVQAGSDANVILTTDDVQTIGAASDTAVTAVNFSGVFSGTSVAFGADGAGPGTSSTYALAVTSSSSGLASHGVAINLFVVSGVVVGSTAATAGAITAGNTIFTVATTNTGIVTLTQFQQIDHAPETPSGAPFNDQFASMVDGLVTLTRSETVVDGDGDQVTGSASVNIGANLHFTDDGPTIGLADRGEPSLTVDETTLGTNDTQSFAANFAASFGADGPAAAGSITYALGISAPGVASGLVDTLSGQPIVLVLNGGVVEGHVGNAAGALAFTVSVNAAGDVTLDQIRAVVHTPDTGPDQSTTLSADTLVTLTATAHDFDGDTASTTINIGTNLNFEDDAPSASTNGQAADTLVLDETRPVGTETDGDSNPAGLATVTANFADNFNAGTFGADGPGSVSYSLVLSGANVASGLFALDPADTTAGDGDGIGRGAQIVLNQAGNIVTGSAGGVDYFTISIDPATGVVTFTQLANVWHANTGSDDDTSTLTALANSLLLQQTVTDADNDAASASLDLSAGIFQIEDDGPDAAVNVQAALDTLVLDETRPVGTETDGDSSPAGLATVMANFADNFVAPVDFGSDGPGSVGYSLSLSGANVASGLFALDPADTSAGDGDGIGRGASIVLNQVGNTITGSAGGVDYFTISINPATGVVTFTQLANVWHSNTGSDDDTSTLNAAVGSVLVNQLVTDADGDSDSASLDVSQGVFQIEDDGPDAAVNVQAALDTLVLDETRPVGTETDGDSSPAGLATITANFADNFVAPIDYGSDGPGSVGYGFLLSGSNVASGLFALDPADTTAGDGDGIGRGAPIVLNLVGNVITGSAGGVDYFTISINPATGVVTFTQLANVWHANAGSDDDTSTLNAAVGAVQIQQTVTDADGDSDAAVIDVSQGVFQIEDDGPDAQTNGQGVGIVTLDETRPEGTDVGGGAPLGDASNTINLAAGFVVGGAVDFGSDGAGSVSYSLALSAPGIGSGLFAIDPTDTSAGDGDGIGRGAEIVLNLSGNTVTGSAGGVDYFTITINPVTGVATFTQLDNIWHPTPGANYDEAAILNTVAAANFQVVQTVTDADGDVDTAAVNIGQGVFLIQDDGLAASPDTDSVSGQNGVATGNVITDLAAGDAGDSDAGADDIGEDTPGRVSFIDNAGDGAAGVAVPVGAGGVDIAGLYGTLHIAANGDYTYTRSGGLGGGQSETFNYTLIDADGDTVVSTLTIQIADTVPVATTSAAIVDDDGLSGGLAGGPNDDNANVGPPAETTPSASEAVFNGTFGGTPGDGATTFLFLANLIGTTASVGTETVTYSLSNAVTGGFNTLTATVTGGARDGTVLFTVNITNATTGTYTVTLLDNVMHPTQNGVIGSDDTENNVSVVINYQMRDADGDNSAAPGQLTINFDDDTPDAQVNGSAQLDTLVLDETRPVGTDAGAGAGAPTGLATTTANFADNFVIAPIPYGADGPGNTAYSLFLSANGIASGLFALDPADTSAGDGDGIGRGASITLSLSGNTITGSVGATNYFTISIDPATGVVTFTQLLPIWHPTPGASLDEAANLSTTLAANMQVVQTITDADGDSDAASVNIGQGVFSIQDDGPDAQTSGVAVGTVTLDESRPEGNDTAGGTAPNGDASNTINFALNFVNGGSVDYGADGPGSTLYSLSLTGANVNSGLFALQGADTSTSDGDGYGQGAQIVLNISGNTITGSVGATNYFTITIDPATGIVTFTQLANIWHPTPGGASFDEAATLNMLAANLMQVVQTVTDADGDVDTASINIGQGVFIIQDDGPTSFDPEAIGTGELFNEAGSSATADLDVDANINNNVGTDTPGLVQFANIANGDDSGFTSNDDAIEYWLSNNGQTLQGRINSTNGTDGTLIFTVQLNQGAGTYTVTMAGEIDNGAGVTFNNLTSTAAGNVDVRAVGADDPATTVDLLLTASTNGANSTINTDSDSIGSGNQSMDQGETVRIDFVTNLEDDPTDNLATFPSGFSYDGHVGTNSLIQAIPQVQGSQGETVAFQVYALNTTVTDAGSPDDTPGNGFSDSTILNTITHVTIDGFDAGEIPVTVALGAIGVWTTIAYGVSAQRQADGSVIFTGVQQGDQYGITTSTDFNAFAVTSLPAGVGPNAANDSSTNSFDLGVFSIGQVDTGDPINLSFDLKLTDADGDSVTVTDALQIQIDPAADALAPLNSQSLTQLADDSSSSSLLASDGQEAQVQKVAANSNTLTMSAALGAAGVAESQAAASPPADDQLSDGSDPQVFTTQVVEKSYADDGDDGSSAVTGVPEAQEVDGAPANSGGHGNGNANGHDNQLDAGSNQQSSDDGSSKQAANDDQGPATAEPQVAIAPAVAMASAAELQAADLDGNAKHNGAVEKIVAEALGQGNGHGTVDALLNAIHGGEGGGSGIANLASPAANAVSAWDMASNGGSAGNNEMLMKVGAEMLHHDMVQPTHNG